MKNKTLSRIYKMLKPQVKSIVIISILAIIINIGELAKPYIMKIAIDDFLGKGIWEKGNITIGILGTIYIGIVILGSILEYIVSTSTSMVGQNIIKNLRTKLYKYTQEANIPFHDKTLSGTIFVRTTSDVEDINTLFKDVISTVAKDIVMIIALIIMMTALEPKLALVCLSIIPIMIIMSITITKISNKVREYSKQVKTKLNIFLAESIYGVKLIKLFNRQYEKEQECYDLCHKFYKSRIPTAYTEGLLIGMMVILENLGVSIIIWAVVNNFLGINAEVGIIYMFITYLKQIFDPLQRIIENFETIQESIVSINKIYDILDKKEYLEDFEKGIEIKEAKGKIEFKNVWFAYEGENWILKNVSFTIQPGQSVAIVGKTGSRENDNHKSNKQIL